MGALKQDWINLDVVNVFVSRTVCVRVTTLYSYEICEVLIFFAIAAGDTIGTAVSGVSAGFSCAAAIFGVVVSRGFNPGIIGLSEGGACSEFFACAVFITVGAGILPDLSQLYGIGLMSSLGKFSKN